MEVKADIKPRFAKIQGGKKISAQDHPGQADKWSIDYGNYRDKEDKTPFESLERIPKMLLQAPTMTESEFDFWLKKVNRSIASNRPHAFKHNAELMQLDEFLIKRLESAKDLKNITIYAEHVTICGIRGLKNLKLQ